MAAYRSYFTQLSNQVRWWGLQSWDSGRFIVAAAVIVFIPRPVDRKRKVDRPALFVILYRHSCTVTHVPSLMYRHSCTITHVPSLMYHHSCTVTHVCSLMYRHSCSLVLYSCVQFCVLCCPNPEPSLNQTLTLNPQPSTLNPGP